MPRTERQLWNSLRQKLPKKTHCQRKRLYWRHDHALWLHPAPEVLVLADRGNQYDVEYEDTLAFNPGAFATTFSWQVYFPSTRKAEVSSLSE